VASAAPGTGARGGDRRRGWELAQWAVAHAHELKIRQVSYSGRERSADDSTMGWRKSGAKATVKSAQDVRITVVQ
jgi:hypothetical protein